MFEAWMKYFAGGCAVALLIVGAPAVAQDAQEWWENGETQDAEDYDFRYEWDQDEWADVSEADWDDVEQWHGDTDAGYYTDEWWERTHWEDEGTYGYDWRYDGS